MKSLLSIGLVSAIIASTATAKPIRCDSFSDAATQAKEKSLPFVVYIHGASWQPVSKRYLKEIWNDPALERLVERDLLFTEVHIEQQLDQDAKKLRDEALKGCNLKAVSSYPAVQFYSESGQLLKTYQGQSMRILGKTSTLNTHLNSLLDTHSQWRKHWKEVNRAQSADDEAAEITALTKVLALPINRDDKAFEALKVVDPDDTSGWVVRSDFKHWDFIRHISGLIIAEKLDEANAEVAKHLENPHFTPVQQAIIHGAKGRILVAEGELEEAYRAFQDAYALDKYGPDGKSLMSYGDRAAGHPLRIVLPKQSTLTLGSLGDNISRNHATATVSSGPEENLPKLFTGSTGRAGYAFHTVKEDSPYLIIDLQESCLVNALYVENRRGYDKRSQNLTLWISDNGSDWKQVWQAEATAPFWDISLAGIERSGQKARYLKLSLEHTTPEHFHLNRIDIFGARP